MAHGNHNTSPMRQRGVRGKQRSKLVNPNRTARRQQRQNWEDYYE